jgi:hypothetical protein
MLQETGRQLLSEWQHFAVVVASIGVQGRISKFEAFI